MLIYKFKKMKKIFIRILGLTFLLLTSCDNDLDQVPENNLRSSSITDFQGVLNSVYFYQQAAATPIAVMGDFRSDNAFMFEDPYTEFDDFDGGIVDMDDQFFSPIYTTLYQAILSANAVIESSTEDQLVGEAKFLRALSYFKLVIVFGDVPINLMSQFNSEEIPVIERSSVANVYSEVIIPDLEDAISVLDNSGISDGLASQLAAKSLLGKVYVFMEDFTNAETYLEDAISDATDAGVELEADFANVVVDENSEIIFATKISTSIETNYDFSMFSVWYAGDDSKSENPIDADLVNAFDDVGDTTRKDLTIDDSAFTGVKYTLGEDNDWIELRLSDIILLYAETLNENDNSDGSESATILTLLDDIRTRAGLSSLSGTASTQDDVRTAILNERRLELALEGHRWFDLVRTDTVDDEMGETIDTNYYLFPLPASEISSTNGVITQNPGY